MEALGFALRSDAVFQTLTEDVVKTIEIEGEYLDRGQVRSSLARRLGVDAVGLVRAERNVDGVVDMLLDTTRNFTAPLTPERLFSWHAALFPTGRSGLKRITVKAWRKPEGLSAAMHVHRPADATFPPHDPGGFTRVVGAAVAGSSGQG